MFVRRSSPSREKNKNRRLSNQYSAFHLLRSRISGQILVEVIVSIAVGTILITAATVAIGSVIRHNYETRGSQTASQMALDQLNKVESLAKANWNSIYNLSHGSANRYFLVVGSTTSVAVSGQEGVLFNDVGAGLAGYWKFDESSGNLAYDFSGSGNNGTLNGSPTRTASSSCKIESCLTFNGTSQYVQVPDAVSLRISPRLTISAWVRTSGSDVAGTIVAKTSGSSGYAFEIGGGGAGNGELAFWDGSWRDSNIIVNDNAWHHVAVTASGTGTLFYKDGVGVAATGGGTLSTGTQPLVIASSTLAGLLDDVRIYNRQLSAAEISQLYRSSVFSRSFYIDNVARTNCGTNSVTTSTPTGCTTWQGSESYILNDPSTQNITSVTAWTGNRSLTLIRYLTRSRNEVFTQTDWTEGSGQDGPFTRPTSQYSTSTNVTALTSLTITDTGQGNGTLTSSIFDMGASSTPQAVIWQGTKPSGTAVNIQIASSNASGGPWTYYGPNGTGDYYSPNPDTSAAVNFQNHNNYRYVRYKVILVPSGGSSPTIDSLTINWSF